ncbi:MAG: Stp1/IreP family PP2C-type Ser/Thr phosphatase, partial [Bacteroidales bacterium]|nr:Stp1/IreP family PP2C-type Ser/Thr phosphatase [Bacteroidales bacterium]
MEIKYSCLTDIGRKRAKNEDSIGEAKTINGHVFIVCDGMGGHAGGQTASSLAVKCVLEFFGREKYSDIYIAINNAIKYANEQIYLKSIASPSLYGMGTTIALLIIKDDNIYFAHVGDSRIYMKLQNHLQRLTKDHSLVQKLVDEGMISESEAENHPRKNEILKALGTAQTIEPEICEKPIQPCKGDMFLLCSDGLNGMISDSDIFNVLNNHTGNDEKISELIRKANEAGGADNISEELIEITGSPHTTGVLYGNKQKSETTETITPPLEPLFRKSSLFRKICWSLAALIPLLALIYFIRFLPEEKTNKNPIPAKNDSLNTKVIPPETD